MLTLVRYEGDKLAAESLDSERRPADFDWDGVMSTAHSILMTMNHYFDHDRQMRFPSITVVDHIARIPV